MKIVKQRSQPLSDQEFLNIKYLAEEIDFVRAKRSGSIVNIASEAREAYVEKVLGFINLKNLKPLKIVLNSGNGAAGPVVDLIRDKLNLRGIDTNFVYVHHTPDPLFPNGIPNPLLEENRSKTANVVVKERADFGVAFDGDFDRCFLFDHEGNFVSEVLWVFFLKCF